MRARLKRRRNAWERLIPLSRLSPQRGRRWGEGLSAKYCLHRNLFYYRRSCCSWWGNSSAAISIPVLLRPFPLPVEQVVSPSHTLSYVVEYVSNQLSFHSVCFLICFRVSVMEKKAYWKSTLQLLNNSAENKRGENYIRPYNIIQTIVYGISNRNMFF